MIVTLEKDSDTSGRLLIKSAELTVCVVMIITRGRGATTGNFYLRCLSRFSEEFVALHGPITVLRDS